ncbi:MAG: regulatory signaling modulator protein AmpE, partial [Gammaproteobacteria bacterium]
LLLGLAVERLLTQLLHLREFHWLDPLFDRLFTRLGKSGAFLAAGGCIILLLLLIVPVALVFFGLQDRLEHIPLFIFSVFVLLFCLGPRDLGEEVIEYREAIARHDMEEVHALATELLEYAPDAIGEVPDVEHAVYAQANNRIFGVVFWFAVLGPVGAWMFRVLDLMRRRAVNYYIDTSGDQFATQSLKSMPVVTATIFLHKIMAWVPARLLMAGYAMAGNYEGAVSAWRNPPPESHDLSLGKSEQLLGAIGCGASHKADDLDVSGKAQVAIDLVVRTLWMVWCPVLALLTIYGAIN